MGKSSPKAPAAPDPAATAAAQTASNKETAYWNAVLNNVNQITPYGSLTYQQTGGGKKYNTDAYNAALSAYQSAPASGGSSGPNPYNPQYQPDQWTAWQQNNGQGGSNRGSAPKLEDFLIGDAPPSFTSTIQLSPEQQAIYDSQTRSQTAMSKLGEDQIGRIRESVSSPFSFNGLADGFTAEDAATASRRGEEAILSRLNPQFQRDEEALRTRLINQGIGQGSEAYNREFENFSKAQNDARMQAILQGANYGGTLQDQALQRRNQGINEYTTQRNAPLNEYIGLTSGVQVQNPQFQNTGYQGASPVDYAGIVNQNYQNQLGQYNAKVAGNNNITNGLFGLGGSFLSGAAGNPAGFAGIFRGQR